MPFLTTAGMECDCRVGVSMSSLKFPDSSKLEKRSRQAVLVNTTEYIIRHTFFISSHLFVGNTHFPLYPPIYAYALDGKRNLPLSASAAGNLRCYPSIKCCVEAILHLFFKELFWNDRKCDSEKTNVRTKKHVYANPSVINHKWSWNCAHLNVLTYPPS